MKRSIEDSRTVSIEDIYSSFISRLPHRDIPNDCYFLQMWTVEQDELKHGSGVIVQYMGVNVPALFDYIINDKPINTATMPLSLENVIAFVKKNMGPPDYGIVIISGEVFCECSFPYNDVNHKRKSSR